MTTHAEYDHELSVVRLYFRRRMLIFEDTLDLRGLCGAVVQLTKAVHANASEW